MTELVVFVLDTARYALPTSCVREILPGMTQIPLPGAPEVVTGVIDVGGRTVVVVSARRRFGLPERAMHPHDHLIVLELGHHLVAMHVDRVVELSRVDAPDLDTGESLTVQSRLISGVVRLAEGLVLVHDPARFLSQVEVRVLDEALARADEVR